MRLWFMIAAFCALFASSAVAQRHSGCSPDQTRVIDAAISRAKDLTLSAAVAVGDTTQFERWFGPYDRLRAEKVRASLKSIATVLRSGAVTVQCNATVSDGDQLGCQAGEYAWVFADEPYLLHVCPPFFDLPALSALRPGSAQSEHGTKEGTIVHEISHFLGVAETQDHCYTRRACARMARQNAMQAIENADSYQYFTEDVTFFARQIPRDKPPPAPRP